jgi:hydrogenase maturation protease
VRVLVIGVGTPRGDDAAGLTVAEVLAAGALPAGIEVRRCERPLPDLLDALAEAEAAVVVDALRPAGTPGRVRRLEREEIAARGAHSSHALGVLPVLELAEALGRAPRSVALLGIEAASTTPAETLSPAVRAAVPEAAALALALARALAGSG